MDQIKIGRFLKELRKEKKLTQEQLAEQLNVSGRTISRWETGSNMPDISLLIDLAELYDVSIPELISGERKSGKMDEESREVAEKMSDYAGEEKAEILKNVKNQSLIGVCAVVVLIVLELIGLPAQGPAREIMDRIHLYCETLAYVTIIMIFFQATGLLYKRKRGSRETSLPRPVMILLAAGTAFLAAALIKFLLVTVMG